MRDVQAFDLRIRKDAAHRFFHAPDGVLEMEYFAGLGFTPLEILTAATRIAAEGLGIADRVGTLAPGTLADVLVVDGDPAEDVAILRDKSRIALMLQAGRDVALPADRGVLGADFVVADAMKRESLPP